MKTAVTGTRHDLIFMGGHFSANLALAADFATTMSSADVAATSTNLTNSIVFSAGCHAGYNLIDPDGISGVTQPLDWAQAFSRKGATLIAGTGYQYGDDELIAYSEKIYAELANQLRIGTGPVALGDALLRSKQAYLDTTPDIRVLHAKSILEATLYGLPMLSVNLPSGRLPAPTTSSSVNPTTVSGPAGAAPLSLQSSDVNTTTPTSPGSPASAHGDYLAGVNGITSNAGAPVLPLQVVDATVPNKVLRGVGFVGGSYTDTAGVTPLTSDVATLIGSTGQPAFTSSFFVPAQVWRTNYFDALAPGGGATKLLLMPAQYRSDGATARKRVYDNVKLRLFYSSFSGDAAKSSAPSITNIQGTASGQTVTFQATVTGDPAAGIASVWLTYTGTGSGGHDQWQSIDLAAVAGNPNLYSATLTLPTGVSAANIRFIVQAANGAGLVTIADNLGAYNRIFDASAPTATVPSTLVLNASPTTGVDGSSSAATATLTSGGHPVAGKTITFSIGSAQAVGATDVDGVAHASIPLGSVPGTGYLLSAGFAGDATLLPSGDSHAFSITKTPTTLTLSGPTSVQIRTPSGVIATLKAGATPVAFKTVWFVLTGTTTITTTVLTDLAGKASLGTATGPGGIYQVTACFDQPSPQGSCPVGSALDDQYSGSAATGSLAVTWPFTGFFQPVDNLPIVNVANAGSAIPVKFSLGGDRGLAIFKSGSAPTVVAFTCNTAPTDVIEEVAFDTASSLTYDSSANQYKYVWKTLKTYAGLCYQLQFRLADGTNYAANFRFK